MASAVGTWVVTVGRDKTPATHYLKGWTTKEQAQRSARQFRRFGMRRPVSVSQITADNCRSLIAREGWCPRGY